MNSVLLVDDEKKFLLRLQADLAQYKDYFQVQTAKNGKEALEVLESSYVDLVVTELKMPVMDGFELLAYLASNFPHIPVIIMTAFGTPEVEKELKASGILSIVEKPIDLDVLADSIIQGLETAAEEGVLIGISLDSTLRFIEMEQKTCLLEVESNDEDKKKSFLFFKKGELYDAISGEIKGEKAALEILALDDVKIRFMKLPRKRPKKRIEKSIMALLMEASRLKDEAAEEKETETHPLADKEVSGDFLALDQKTEEVRDQDKLEAVSKNELETSPVGVELREKSSEIESIAINSFLRKGSSSMDQEFERLPETNLTSGDTKWQRKNQSRQKEKGSQVSATLISKGGNQMAVKEVLQEMAQEIDNLIATGVQGMDGVELAKHNPTNAPTEQFAARFAMIMKLEQKVCKELGQLGNLEENIMQTEKAFVYTRMLGTQHYLGIAISKEGTLGMVRMVAQKYADKLNAELS